MLNLNILNKEIGNEMWYQILFVIYVCKTKQSTQLHLNVKRFSSEQDLNLRFTNESARNKFIRCKTTLIMHLHFTSKGHSNMCSLFNINLISDYTGNQTAAFWLLYLGDRTVKWPLFVHSMLLLMDKTYMTDVPKIQLTTSGCINVIMWQYCIG